MSKPNVNTNLRMHRKKIKPPLKREDLTLCLMAFPTVAFLIVFCYLPMGGLVMAFQNFNTSKGVIHSPFVGFKNFEFLFATTDSWIITRNTICYNLVFIVVNLFVSITLALMLSSLRTPRYGKVMHTIYMMPHFLSYAVVAILVNAFLDRNNGLINIIIRFSGEAGLTNWYHRREIWPPLLVFVNAWKNVGYSTVLYLAVITGISVELYEAAQLDGANNLQKALYITLPHLRYIVGISLILSMGSIFQGDFGLFYNVPMNEGMLFPVTDVIDTYIYRALTYLSNVGMSSAAGFYQSVVGFVLVLVANKIVSKIDPDCAMF